MKLDQVIFGGRLPDRVQQAGVLNDDQEHFRQLVLGKAEVQSQLGTYMYYRVRLETEHTQVMREKRRRVLDHNIRICNPEASRQESITTILDVL
ncbi:MAG: hypothetical protein ACKPKO_40335 [Candidatus Fonsibacter sp.]